MLGFFLLSMMFFLQQYLDNDAHEGPEILPPEHLSPGTPYWSINADGQLELIKSPENFPAFLGQDYAENFEQDDNFMQYFTQLFQQGLENLPPIFSQQGQS
ncbi:hypothetical protein DMENIID0001_083620 [Sergentomyia squamirostris]